MYKTVIVLVAYTILLSSELCFEGYQIVYDLLHFIIVTILYVLLVVLGLVDLVWNLPRLFLKLSSYLIL